MAYPTGDASPNSPLSDSSPTQPPTSPQWGSTAKLIVGLTFVVIFIGLLAYLRGVIAPLLLAFVLVYLLHPLIARVSKFTRLPWRTTVNLVYALLIVFLLVVITASGVVVVQQVQNLVTWVQNFIFDLPNLAKQISSQVYVIGPFRLDLSQLDLASQAERVLGYAQPLLSRLGDMVSSLATGTISVFGWGSFVLVLSYFMLVDSGQVTADLLYINIPGYDSDIRRIGAELRHTWNAWLRGNLIMWILAVLSYTVVMTVLGVHYPYAIGLLAGFGRFIPYLGPLTTYVTLFLVTYFQGGNYFGMQAWQFSVLSIAIGIVLDNIFDNFISPRVFGRTMGVKPAAVLIAALIAANLIGMVGLILAGPVLASLNLLGRYAVRKMLDLDPWPPEEEHAPASPPQPSIQDVAWKRAQDWFQAVRKR